MANTQEIVDAWWEYLDTVHDWQALTEGIEPKVGGCGLVYEVPNPIERPGESFAIADMRNLELSEPHKHINGETEIYFVLQGIGKIVVGSEMYPLGPRVAVITNPDTMHVTLPKRDLVLAVVNTPPFDADNYVVVDEKEAEVIKAVQRLRAA